MHTPVLTEMVLKKVSQLVNFTGEGEKEKNWHICVKEWYWEDNLDVTWKGLTDLSVIPSSSNMLQ